MKKVVNLSFREGGKTTRYTCEGIDLKPGDRVMAQNQGTLDLGTVIGVPMELDEDSEELDSTVLPLDETRKILHSSVETSGLSEKHTFVSASIILNKPLSTVSPAHERTGESFVTFCIPGNGSSFSFTLSP